MVFELAEASSSNVQVTSEFYKPDKHYGNFVFLDCLKTAFPFYDHFHSRLLKHQSEKNDGGFEMNKLPLKNFQFGF